MGMGLGDRQIHVDIIPVSAAHAMPPKPGTVTAATTTTTTHHILGTSSPSHCPQPRANLHRQLHHRIDSRPATPVSYPARVVFPVYADRLVARPPIVSQAYPFQ